MPLHRARAFDHLEQTLKEALAGRPALFVPNGGNWGDSLIRAGSLAFFADRGIDVVTVPPVVAYKCTPAELCVQAGLDDPVLLLGGGGALNRFYQRRVPLSRLARGFRQTIVLPSTYGLPAHKLGFPPATLLFRRDEHSRRLVPRSRFCHDMAFYLRPSAARPGEGRGYFFRTDIERAAGFSPPAGNRDLSTEGWALRPVDPFFEAIAAFEEIHTSRLHVGIAAALLGRKVALYPNAYFKNEAVFEASLGPHFENARLGRYETFEASAADHDTSEQR